METYAFDEPGRYARGWHIVLFSQELAPGETRALRYFERDLVLFRSETGAVGAVDAFCPHLGAHLGGAGAAVVGENLRCPFHGWQFDGRGTCVHIPNAKRIPDRAKNALGSWRVEEKCGFIALWHDPDGGDPDYELPDIPNWGEADWGEWQFRRSRVATQGKEIIENIADKAHFAFVHGGVPIDFDVTFEGHTVSQFARIRTNPDGVRIVPSAAPDWWKQHFANPDREPGFSEGRATYYGPAVMYFESSMRAFEVDFRTVWLNFHVPVNGDEVDLCSGVIMAPIGDDPIPAEFRAMYPEIAHLAFAQDIEIWRDKVYRAEPILSDADGPILKLRRWYDQFYRSRSPSASPGE